MRYETYLLLNIINRKKIARNFYKKLLFFIHQEKNLLLYTQLHYYGKNRRKAATISSYHNINVTI